MEKNYIRNAGFEERKVYKQQINYAIKNLNYSTNQHIEIHPYPKLT